MQTFTGNKQVTYLKKIRVGNESDIEILPVKNQRELNRFIDFPYQLYRPEPNWVPPLRISQREMFNSKHLFWQRNPHQFFIAKRNGRIAGRIGAFINNEHNSFHHTNEACFGFLEGENNLEVFRALFAAAEHFAEQQNCSQITGPLNPSLHYELGILTDGFDQPSFLMLTYNYPYYNELINSCGYNKLKDFYSYKLISTQYEPTPKMKRVSAFLQQRHAIKIRSADMRSFGKELDILFSIYNDAFIDHWGFTPMQKDEFKLLAKDMKQIIDPRLVLIAEMNDEPIGFLLCLPNFNEVFIKIKDGRLFPSGIFRLLWGKKKIRSARVITAAIKKKYQYLGIGALLYAEIMKRGLQFNYPECELSWVAEDNMMMRQVAEDLSAVPYKTYRLYSKAIKI